MGDPVAVMLRGWGALALESFLSAVAAFISLTAASECVPASAFAALCSLSRPSMEIGW